MFKISQYMGISLSTGILMVRYFILIFLLSLPSFTYCKQKSEDDKLIDKIALETSRYYRSLGLRRPSTEFKKYAKSAVTVSRIFNKYPAGDEKDRILRMYSMGGQESMLRPNFVNVNVPGMKYSSGRVKFFSLDYGWVGINERNFNETYEIAKLRQKGVRLTSSRHGVLKFREDMNEITIPRSINLKQIDLNLSIEAKNKWIALIKKGYTPYQMYKNIRVQYKEESQNDIDSMLIYRLIVETERYRLGWKYNWMDEEMYNWLKKRV